MGDGGTRISKKRWGLNVKGWSGWRIWGNLRNSEGSRTPRTWKDFKLIWVFWLGQPGRRWTWEHWERGVFTREEDELKLRLLLLEVRPPWDI